MDKQEEFTKIGTSLFDGKKNCFLEHKNESIFVGTGI
jgi:hypothetical protein